VENSESSDPSHRKMEIKRLETLDRVSKLARLTDDRYFVDALKAVSENDAILWKSTCEKVGIPEKTAENLWKVVKAKDELYADVW
jgi:hypothetical protein